MCFTLLSILTEKQQIAYLVMVSIILKENAIYASSLRQKSFFKAMKLTNTLLLISSTSLLLAKWKVDQRG